MAERVGTVNYNGTTYYVYREKGNADNVHPFYFGMVKGDHDKAPYCAYSSIASLLRAKGWSARTPVKSV